MAVTKQQKEEILKELTDKMKEAKSVVFAEYKGMSVKDMSDMRAKMREKGVNFQVSKKTLIQLAAKASGFDTLPEETMEGAVGIAFSMEDELAAAKIIHTIGKENKNLQLRGAIFEGRILSTSETKELALIPGKEELLGKFVFLVKYPIQGFHGVLSNTLGGFVRVLNAVKEKQEQTA